MLRFISSDRRSHKVGDYQYGLEFIQAIETAKSAKRLSW